LKVYENTRERTEYLIISLRGIVASSGTSGQVRLASNGLRFSSTLENLTHDPSQATFFLLGLTLPPAPDMRPGTLAHSQSAPGIPVAPVIGSRSSA
jgi:hypothetical protein